MSEGRNRPLPNANPFRYGFLGTEGHVNLEQGYDNIQPRAYKSAQFINFKVLFMMTGTLLWNPILWTEQVLNFALMATTVAYLHWKPPRHLIIHLDEEDPDIRAFCSLLSSLAAFLLSFLMAIRITKWWNLRINLQQLTHANAHTQLLLSMYVTKDFELLDAISRYIRASIMTMFIKARGYFDSLEVLKIRGILTASEYNRLQTMSKHGQEVDKTLWCWHAGIIKKLLDAGLITSDTLYQEILCLIDEYLQGWYSIQTELQTQIPMKYVHLMGWMIKVHNLILSVMMGILAWGVLRRHHYVMVALSISRVFVVTFVYNGILVIDQELGNPFCGNLSGFSMEAFDYEVYNTMDVITSAVHHMPHSLKHFHVDPAAAVEAQKDKDKV